MSPGIRELFETHVAGAYDKQLFLADLVEEHDWRFEMNQGTISFGPKQTWKVQVVGSEAEASNTWLWAWANFASSIPAPLLRSAETLRRLGVVQSVPELITPQLPLADVDGAMITVIASGVCEAQGFYRVAYPGGAAFLLIDDPDFPRFIVEPFVRISIVFPKVIAAYEVNHRKAFAGHLAYYGLESRADGPAIVAFDSTGPRLRAEFDAMDRLSKVETMRSTASPAG